MYLRMNPMSEADFERVWVKIDADGSGDVDFVELCDFFGVDPDAAQVALADRHKLGDDELMRVLQRTRTMEASPTKKTGASREEAKGASTHSFRRVTLSSPQKGKNVKGEEDRELELLQCCQLGETDAIVKLIDDGVSMYIEDEKSEAPLHKLARGGKLAAASKLIEKMEADRAVSADDLVNCAPARSVPRAPPSPALLPLSTAL